MKQKASRIVTFCISLILWLLLSFSLDWQHLIVGLLVAAITAGLLGDMFVEQGRKWLHPRRFLWFGYYVLVFSWECLKSNIDVAWRVLHPRLLVRPGIVKVRTSLKTETGLTFLANGITLTPGTLTVDIDKEAGILYIHWIDVQTQDIAEASQVIVSKFERILKEVFE
jgi:multicomponent Na+:H+ antiporter subunit E